MRSVNLLKLAFEAELLRLRAMMARQARRAAFGAIAVVFGLAVLTLAEVTGWQALLLKFEPLPATLLLLGVNLAIAAVFGVLAARSTPGHTEREALRVRRQALEAARVGLAVLTLAEVTGWQALLLKFEPLPATLLLLGVNLAIAAVFGVLAARSTPGHTEREALRVRRQALEAARGSLAFTAAVPAATALLGMRRGSGRRRSWLRPFGP